MTESQPTPPPAQSRPVDLKKGPMDALRRRAETWLLRRRRSRAAKRKMASRKTTVVLTIIVILLLSAFAWSLNYLSPHTEGNEITIDQLAAMAAEKRLPSATFLDED